MDSIVERVIGTISEILEIKVEHIKHQNSLEDLGADSLEKIETAMALEEEFDIKISEEEEKALSSMSINRITQYIESRLKEPQSKEQ